MIEWWQWGVLGFLAVLSIVTLRVGLRFDLNTWQERRDDKLRKKAQGLCTHTYAWEENGQIYFKSAVTSPIGRTDGFCEKCGLHFIGGLDQAQRITARWAKNPVGFPEQERAFDKAARKVMR